MNELLYTEGDVRFSVATAKSEIKRLTAENTALAEDCKRHFNRKLFYRQEASDLRDKVDAMTAENAALKEVLVGWHARFLDMEIERDAALAASRHETDMCQQALEDLEKMRGESGVLRGLLNEALGVLETITDEQEPDDWMLLMALKGKIGAAIVPNVDAGGLI